MTPQDQPNPLKEEVLEATMRLYNIQGDCPPEIAKAIDMLRQLINEVYEPKRLITSQEIYDVLNPAIKAYFLDLIGNNETVVKPVGSVGVDLAEAAKIRNQLRQELREKQK